MFVESWPNFFIVGAPKAGTTSMYFYLSHVPDIFMSPVKEPRYFSSHSLPDDYPYVYPIRKKSKYLALFSNVKTESIIGEASPEYLADQEAPKLIYQVSPNARILAILRNPITRAFSHYLMTFEQGIEELSFYEALEYDLKHIDDVYKLHYLEPGLYSKQVQRYLDIFGQKQVKIIIFEEFINNTKKTVKEVLEFLNITSNSPNIVENTYNPFSAPKNEVIRKLMKSKFVRLTALKYFPTPYIGFAKKYLTKEVKKPIMSEQEKTFLKQFYQEDILKLEKILERSLPWEF